MSAERQVAIVGMAGVFPTCHSLENFSEKLFSDQSLIRNWELATLYGKNIRSTVAGYVNLSEMHLDVIMSTLVKDYPETYIDNLARIPAINLATADIGSIWAMIASIEAIRMAGWEAKEVKSEKTGVIIGSGGAGNTILRPGWNSFFELGIKSRTIGSHTIDRSMGYREAANVSCLIKSQGVCESIISACATGLGNIGYAYRLIKFGVQDRIIAGGIEETSIETFIGFDAMQVLSKGFTATESSRPFDKNRNGFVCSFGAGIIALEELAQARARGANILAVIDGYHNNSDGDGNMFAPSFSGQQRLWQGLMNDSGKQDKQNQKPDVVKVHGTSTPAGDAIELLSVVDFMGTDNYHLSAPKSQFGHMLGAAGAVECITALLMLREQKVSPCLNSANLNTEPEPFQLNADWLGPVEPLAAYRQLIPQKTVSKEINKIVCLNYGFGGTNSAISLSKFRA